MPLGVQLAQQLVQHLHLARGRHDLLGGQAVHGDLLHAGEQVGVVGGLAELGEETQQPALVCSYITNEGNVKKYTNNVMILTRFYDHCSKLHI